MVLVILRVETMMIVSSAAGYENGDGKARHKRAWDEGEDGDDEDDKETANGRRRRYLISYVYTHTRR